MTVDNFLSDNINGETFDPPNFSFWVRTVIDAMALLGPETDADLERMSKLLLDYHSGAGIDPNVINGIRHEIVRLRGVSYWRDTTLLGLKYRCINAIADSGEKNPSCTDALQHSFEIAFWIINDGHNLDEAIIALIQENASKYGLSLLK